MCVFVAGNETCMSPVVDAQVLKEVHDIDHVEFLEPLKRDISELRKNLMEMIGRHVSSNEYKAIIEVVQLSSCLLPY